MILDQNNFLFLHSSLTTSVNVVRSRCMDLFMRNVPFNPVSQTEDIVMTSDTTEKSNRMSAERQKLDLVLSSHRVNLSRFTPGELQDLLQHWLYQVDPRELRGFTELQQTISRRGEPPFSISLSVAPDAEIVLSSEFNGPLDLKTHTMTAYRGALSSVYTYGRHESDEETTDWQVASSWGEEAYLVLGKETTLLFRRQPNHSRGDENLILVNCHFQKVPHEDNWLVQRIVAEQISIGSFSERFGAAAPKIAVSLIWAIRDIVSRTHKELVSTADTMKRRLDEWEGIAKAIRCDR